MNTYKKVNEMAHLKQKFISDSSCKSIIIDTIMESPHSLTQSELSSEITAIFHVLVSSERLDTLVEELLNDGIIVFDAAKHLKIDASKEADFILAKLQETNLQKQATIFWLEYIKSFQEISEELERCLSLAFPVFLRSLFVKHGVSSYELLTSKGDTPAFDIKQIAKDIASQFDNEVQLAIENILPTVFQSEVLSQCAVMEYLKHSINKAVGYVSEVISKDTLAQITNGLKNLTIYLDTNTLYRLLNLQGSARYDSIKGTIDFCKKNGVKLKISALTKKELSSRLKYDAEVLRKFPTRVDLLQFGYKYRSSDNYVSTYWHQARETNISVDDYIEHYLNFDVFLETEQIDIETIVVDEEALMNNAKDIYEKMSLRDRNYTKADGTLWHDAYNFAYIQKMQKPGAYTAIDTECLFLTADQGLLALQREDHDLKKCPPVAITPSQLLQLYSFSQPDGGYEETFIKFFASSSIGLSFEYENKDIQEILSRIGHYHGFSVEIAEKILGRMLLNSRYTDATDEEKEEIIYRSISDELLDELNLVREQVSSLESENNKLNRSYQEITNLLSQNEQEFQKERDKLQAIANDAQAKKESEVGRREQVERESKEVKQFSEAQQRLYVDENWRKWKRRHILIFCVSIISIPIIVVFSIALSMYKKDSGCLGFLALVAIPIFALPYGFQIFSVGAETEFREKFTKDYQEKVRQVQKFKSE